jgi:hypothetical protein
MNKWPCYSLLSKTLNKPILSVTSSRAHIYFFDSFIFWLKCCLELKDEVKQYFIRTETQPKGEPNDTKGYEEHESSHRRGRR